MILQQDGWWELQSGALMFPAMGCCGKVGRCGEVRLSWPAGWLLMRIMGRFL
jgi:hypothetical protein